MAAIPRQLVEENDEIMPMPADRVKRGSGGGTIKEMKDGGKMLR